MVDPWWMINLMGSANALLPRGRHTYSIKSYWCQVSALAKYTDDSLRLCFGHVSLRGAQIGIISGGNPKFVMQQIGVRGGEAS